MKTLRKTLSLTLVFALVFSLMSFAFAADTTTTTKAPTLSDFTDANKLTYTEAADYLIAAGIVKGDTATTLNPKGDFTRAQAAKLVAYAALGQIAADKLAVSSAPFKDVDASNWAAGYIAYCQKQGFVNGYGDGNFGPNDKVTGYQMAKMLLCSIGYGVNGEFTGSGWELSVAPVALSYGIFTNNAAGASAVAATREEAFLYTFNTLSTLCSVSYNKNLGVYYVPGRDAMTTNPKSATIGTAADTRKDTVGAVKFNMKRVIGQTGDFGEAAHYWAKSNTKVTGKYSDATSKKLASSINGTTFANLQNNGKSTYIGFKADSTLKYFYNGDELNIEAAMTANKSYAVGDYILVGSIAAGGTIYEVSTAINYTTLPITLTAGTNVTSKGTFAFDGKRGVEVNFYDTDENGKYDVVEFLQDKITKVTADATATASGSVTLVTVSGISGLSAIKSDNVDGYDGLKKGDYVTYHTNIAGDTWTITKCGSFTGAMAAYNTTAGVAMIGTTQYKTSELAYQSGSNPNTKFATDYTNLLTVADSTYYTDKGGNLVDYIAGSSVAKLSNTVYVIGAAKIGYTYQAKLLDSNGALSYVNISKIDDVAVTGIDSADPATYLVAGTNKTFNKFYTYSKNTDGSYNLTTVTSQIAGTYDAASETVFAKGAANFYYDTTPAIQNKLASAATVFVIEGNTSGTYKAYTGVGTNPKVTSKASGTYASVLYDADGYAVFAVAVGGVVDTSNTDKNYIFTSAPATTFKDGNGNYYGYTTSALNGAITPVVYATGTTALIPGTLQAIQSYDSSRVQSASLTDTRIIDPVYDVQSFRVNGTTLAAYSNNDGTGLAGSYVAASDCKYFLYDVTDAKNPTLKASTADEISGLSGKYYEVQGVKVSDTNSQLAQVYVTVYSAPVLTADLTIAAGTKGLTVAASQFITSRDTTNPTILNASGYTTSTADQFKFTSTYLTNAAVAPFANVQVIDVTTPSAPALKTFNGDITVAAKGTTAYAIGFYAQPFVYQVRYAAVTVA